MAGCWPKFENQDFTNTTMLDRIVDGIQFQKYNICFQTRLSGISRLALILTGQIRHICRHGLKSSHPPTYTHNRTKILR